MTDVMVGPQPLEDWLGLIRAEFQEVPDLRLTLNQAEGLWELGAPDLEAILETFVDVGYLQRSCDGVYSKRRPWA